MAKWLTRARCEAHLSLSERMQRGVRRTVEKHLLPSFCKRSTLFDCFDRIMQDQRQRAEYRRSMRG